MTKKLILQPYPRESNSLLAEASLFPLPEKPCELEFLNSLIRNAFERCNKNKLGMNRTHLNTPEEWVNLILKHLKERSDPILSSHFVSQLRAEELFELDAVSYEMQRHRMTIGIFYHYCPNDFKKQYP